MKPRPRSLCLAVAGATCAAALSAVLSAGCNTYQDQLSRAEQHYQNARYEAALANLEDLEFHTTSLSRVDRVRYDVVRGMTHLRLEQRPDARHWLALAREEAQGQPGALSEQSRNNVEQTIAQLDPLGPPAGAGDAGASGGDDAGTAPALSR